jgi:glycogen debranching enzyme
LTALTSKNTTPYSSAFYLTNSEIFVSPGGRKINHERLRSYWEIPKESLAIHRRRFIERDVREEFFVTNVSKQKLHFSLSFEVDSDFADLFEVKNRVFEERADMPRMTPFSSTEQFTSTQTSRKFLQIDNAFDFKRFDSETGFQAETLVWFSQRGRVKDAREISYDIFLEPRETFHTSIAIVLLANGEKKRGKYTDQYFQNQEHKIEKALQTWDLRIPRLETNWDELKHSYYQSLVDIVALKMTDPTQQFNWELPAAGCPWFMTVFGRDTLITSYQTLLFGSAFAIGAIEALARYQARVTDNNRDAEPGKIVHELRYGAYAARSNRFPYYGSIDATPLFLILVSEIYRWTKNAAFVNKHRENIVSALNWIDNYGDIDGDGFLEYKKKSKEGLDNQCWKDSWNSIQFSNGKIAKPPIAACEVQGYAYDAKVRIAEIAKEVWREKSLAKKLLDEANDLKELFNEKFWIEEKGYYALALDNEKKQVDSLTSNIGHLLWSGIVDDDKADSVAEKLMGRNLFSGYGIRTMSTNDVGYSPLGYHTGCVWAHDNSLIASGLARYGKWKEANRIVDAIFDAAPHFGFTLPEAFAGFSRLNTGFPVRYPTSSSPQAWAAGSPLLLLRTLLGLAPSADRRTIELHPISTERETEIELVGCEAFGKKFTISIIEGSKPTVCEITNESEERTGEVRF